MTRLALAALLIVACGPVTAPYVSHATPPRAGWEWHSCPAFENPLLPGPWECPEGYACTRHGCEWCGGDDGVRTRCTDGSD